MYENGGTSALTTLLSSKDLAEFLNNAESVAKISQYDRSMLEKCENLQNTIKDQENTAKEEKASIDELLAERASKQQEVQNLAASTSDNISSYVKQPGKQLRRKHRQKLRQHRNRHLKTVQSLSLMIQILQMRHLLKILLMRSLILKIPTVKTAILPMTKIQTPVIQKIHLTVLHQMIASHLQKLQVPARENILVILH